jgi:hypothetical protein
MNTELLVTLGVLAFEGYLMRLFYVRAKRPVDPRRPRILPYGALLLFLGLAAIVTSAHVISVVTGHQLEARNKMKGQQN